MLFIVNFKILFRISVTKSERKLKKNTLYSLNYILIIVIFPLISIFLGWPFMSGAMVRSNAHCISMAKWSANNVPGVPNKSLFLLQINSYVLKSCSE